MGDPQWRESLGDGVETSKDPELLAEHCRRARTLRAEPAARTEAFDRFAAHSPDNARAITAANPSM